MHITQSTLDALTPHLDSAGCEAAHHAAAPCGPTEFLRAYIRAGYALPDRAALRQIIPHADALADWAASLPRLSGSGASVTIPDAALERSPQ